MNFGPIIAAGLLAAVTSHAPVASSPSHELSPNLVAAANPVSPEHAAGSPKAGDLAPDFTYQSAEELWQNLHNMLDQGSVLLVFGAGDEQLRKLERSRESLLSKGVIPVAVLERRDSDVWRLVRRLGLGYSVLADPHGSVAGQFGVFDEPSHHGRPSWFVIDARRHVRGSGENLASIGEWTPLASAALGLSDVKSASTP